MIIIIDNMRNDLNHEKKERKFFGSDRSPKSDNLISLSVFLSVCVLCTLCIQALSKVQNACMLLASSFSHMQTFRNNDKMFLDPGIVM